MAVNRSQPAKSGFARWHSGIAVASFPEALDRVPHRGAVGLLTVSSAIFTVFAESIFNAEPSDIS
jgi:hypothetical protein